MSLKSILSKISRRSDVEKCSEVPPLGVLYGLGDGVKRDSSKAIKALKSAKPEQIA